MNVQKKERYGKTGVEFWFGEMEMGWQATMIVVVRWVVVSFRKSADFSELSVKSEKFLFNPFLQLQNHRIKRIREGWIREEENESVTCERADESPDV